MPDRSIWVCPSRYRRLSTASVARPLRQNSKPAIADNALFLGLLRASQVYICRKTFGYLLRLGTESVGLMQTLVTTARQVLGMTNLTADDLLNPATSIRAGTAYIAQQRVSTHFDPPLVAAAYNAGSLRREDASANRWK